MAGERNDVSILRGSCSCGGVRFEISGPIVGINECHCSKCRKETGTGSSTFIPVYAEQFRWTSGAELVDPRYSRCRNCGSLTPDDNGRVLNVPAGVLDDDIGIRVAHHIFVGSKASWDVIGDDAPQYEEDDCPPLVDLG